MRFSAVPQTLAFLSVLAGLLAGSAAAASANPRLTTDPALSPAFGWSQKDYVVRCQNKPVISDLKLPAGWRAKAGAGNLRSGDFEKSLPLKAGRSFTVTFRNPSGRPTSFHVRCLPTDFPQYRVAVQDAGAPRLTVVNLANRYAVAFDAGGAPVWWFRHNAEIYNPEIFTPGTYGQISVRNLAFERYEIRSLAGKLIRTLQPVGNVLADAHDLQRLPNGNYMFGAHRRLPFDARPFGGIADGTLDTTQIQEVRPNGKLVWKWNSYPQIRPAETGRWWKIIRDWGQPYDSNHWNSVDRRGRYMLLSFRHLDAIYKIDRRSGKIVWKLGGTKTGKSLKIKGDPYGRYPFGGQHDARFMPDGSVTVFDNQSYFDNRRPRAVRYMIDEKRRTATMLRQITDSRFKASLGFGSARVGRSGNWIVCWGATGKGGSIAAYDPTGRAFYRIYTPGVIPYRANPVYGPKPTISQIRHAMNKAAAG